MIDVPPETMLKATVEWMLRAQHSAIAPDVREPPFPAIRYYDIDSDDLAWVRCDDPIVLRVWSRLYPDNVNAAGKEKVRLM